MDAPSRRRGAGAEKDSPIRRGVRVDGQDRPGQKLQQRVRPAADVAADHIRVIRFELCGVHSVTLKDAGAESGSEALDLTLDRVRHISWRTAGGMTLGPAWAPA